MRPHGTDHASPTLPAFEPLDSVRSRWASLATGGIACGLAVSWCVLTILAAVLLFDASEPLALRAGIAIIAAAPWLAIPWIVAYARRTGAAMFDAMRVDRQGLHWVDRGRVVDTLTWEALAQAPGDGPDIDAITLSTYVRGTRINRDVLVAWRRRNGTQRIQLFFRGGRLFRNIYANEGQLRARFLLGVRTFRPDLRIGDNACSRFSIDPATSAYRADGRLSDLVGWLVVAAVAALVYAVVWQLAG